MAEKFEDIEFIELVRQQPLLFDKSHANYMNNQKKAQVWANIGAKVGLKGSNFLKLLL